MAEWKICYILYSISDLFRKCCTSDLVLLDRGSYCSSNCFVGKSSVICTGGLFLTVDFCGILYLYWQYEADYCDKWMVTGNNKRKWASCWYQKNVLHVRYHLKCTYNWFQWDYSIPKHYSVWFEYSVYQRMLPYIAVKNFFKKIKNFFKKHATFYGSRLF